MLSNDIFSGPYSGWFAIWHSNSYLLTKTWNNHENRSLINWKGLYMYINHHKGSLASCALHHNHEGAHQIELILVQLDSK